MQAGPFRDVMARLAHGVAVVSAVDGEGYRGMTVTSLTSISASPPMVLVGLERESATRGAVVASRAFNLSLLARSQEFIADRLAGRTPAVDEKWSSLPHRLGTNGAPLLDGCAGWLECRLVEVYGAGDHDICVGEVEVATLGQGDPLVLWDRSYWTLR